MIITKLDPKIRELIQSITELDKDKVYLLELSLDLSLEQFNCIAQSIKSCFDNAGVKCLIAPTNVIQNIYELEEGGKN